MNRRTNNFNMNRKMFERFKADHSGKTKVVKGLVLFLFFVLFTRMFYMQIIDYDKYDFLSKSNSVKEKRLDAERGKIYDKNGVLLVTNSTGYRVVYLKGRDFEEQDINRISELTGFTGDFIKNRIERGDLTTYTKENLIIDNIDEKLAHKVMEKIKEEDVIQIQTYSKRKYIYDSFASHVIGFVKKISPEEYQKLKDKGYSNRDLLGKEGIEKQYDEQLRGVAGVERLEVNAHNKFQRRIDKQLPVAGEDIYLTIDYRLQKYMEDLLEKEGMQGAFIALNPKTGEILTQVSYPNYSLTAFSTILTKEEWTRIINDPRRPLTDKVIAGEYPPGSVFKPVSALAFLESGIDPKQQIFDPGYYQIGPYIWKTWKIGGHGWTDMAKSFVESVNTYYYKFSDIYGYKLITYYGKLLGLGKKTGIDLPGEKKGVIPDPEWKKEFLKQGWRRGDTINMSIGQGYVLSTPIQIAQVYEAFANRGIFYSPRLVGAFEDKNGRREIAPQKIAEIEIPSKYYDILADGFRQAVESPNGTSKSLRTSGMTIVAKSGSAENSIKNTKRTHAWIAGYFPMNNPEIVFVSILENAGGGGAVAGGVAKKFVDRYLELKRQDAIRKPTGKIVEWNEVEEKKLKEKDLENAVENAEPVEEAEQEGQNNDVAVPDPKSR
ncbi:MAG: penicillin-binding protein 2 [Fusobacteriaceae bacterium]